MMWASFHWVSILRIIMAHLWNLAVDTNWSRFQSKEIVQDQFVIYKEELSVDFVLALAGVALNLFHEVALLTLLKYLLRTRIQISFDFSLRNLYIWPADSRALSHGLFLKLCFCTLPEKGIDFLDFVLEGLEHAVKRYHTIGHFPELITSEFVFTFRWLFWGFFIS